REPNQHADRGRLAGAIRAEEPEDLTGVEREGDVRDDLAPAEPLREVLGDQHRLGGRGVRLHRVNGSSRPVMARGTSRFWLWTAPVAVGTVAAVVLGAGLVLALRGAAGDPLGEPAPPARAVTPTPPPGGVRRILVIGDSLARGTGDETGRGF